MKNWRLQLLILAIIQVSLFGCSKDKNSTSEQNTIKQETSTKEFQPETISTAEEKSQPPKANNSFFHPTLSIQQQDMKLETIAQDLLRKYLEHFKDPKVPELERLKDFIIKEVKIEKISESGFVCSTKFSVQAAVENTAWVAGNGILKSGGLIEDKYMFVHISKDGNTYTFEAWGTSP